MGKYKCLARSVICRQTLRPIATELSFSSIGWKTKHNKKPGEPRVHFTKLLVNKAIIEVQVLHDSTYMMFPNGLPYRRRVEWLLPGVGGRLQWGVLWNGYGVLVMQDEWILEITVQHCAYG